MGEIFADLRWTCTLVMSGPYVSTPSFDDAIEREKDDDETDHHKQDENDDDAQN